MWIEREHDNGGETWVSVLKSDISSIGRLDTKNCILARASNAVAYPQARLLRTWQRRYFTIPLAIAKMAVDWDWGGKFYPVSFLVKEYVK